MHNGRFTCLPAALYRISTTSGDSNANTVYSLSAVPLVNLNKHVGQKVELTGRMQPTVREFGAVGTTGTIGAQTQGEFTAPAHSRFEVSGVKMLSATCE